MSSHSNRSRGFFWGAVLIISGFLFLLDEYGFVDVGDLWPLAVIGVGIWFIIKARHPKEKESFGENFGDKSVILDTDNVIQSNTFGDLNITINSSDFKSGEVRTVFGDVKVDISDLHVKSDVQILYLNNVFGDIKVSVPKNLPFSIYSSNTAGDMKIFGDKKSGWRQTVSYQSEGYDIADGKLKIVTSQVFGDLKVW